MVKEMSQKLTAQMVCNNVVDTVSPANLTLIKRTLRRDNVPHWAGRAAVSCLPPRVLCDKRWSI